MDDIRQLLPILFQAGQAGAILRNANGLTLTNGSFASSGATRDSDIDGVGAQEPQCAKFGGQRRTVGMKLQDLFRRTRRGIAGLALFSTALAGDPLITRNTTFRIPFAIEAKGESPVQNTAILFASVNGGPMEPAMRVPATAGGFQFVAPADGLYGFTVRMTDVSGNIAGEAAGLTPELEVLVDTVAPDLNIQVVETAPGQVDVLWNSGQSKIAPGSVRLEYAEGANGRWQPIPNAVDPSGRVSLKTQTGTSVSVRGFLTDLAGNEGSGTAQIALTASPVATAPANTSNNQPATQNLAQTGSQQQNSNSILGPNPFAQPAANNPVASPQRAAAANAPARPMAIPQQPIAQQPIPPSITPGTAGNQIGQQGNRRPAPTAGNVGRGMTIQPNPTAGTYNNTVPAGFPNRPVNTPQTAPVNTQPYNPELGGQLVASAQFDLAYELEDVGPSGVSAVELFVTENNGQQWFRYGTDIDVRSPIQVDTRSEGTFGFAVRVRNGIGFTEAPPQPGEAPSIVITVDHTRPTVNLGTPQVIADGQGLIRLDWQVSDRNPSGSPVRLEFADSPTGPWTPLFDWQLDVGSYEMPVQPGLPTALFFRLHARDAAGNVTTSQTPQALVVDQHRPRATLLRVEPVSISQRNPSIGR